MLLKLYLCFIAVAAGVAVWKWRLGVFAAIIVVMVQDPVRKLLPGAPGFTVLSTVPVWLGVMAGACFDRERHWQSFRETFPRVLPLLAAMAACMLPAAVLSATYGPGSWKFTLRGIYTYGSLLAALVLGFRYPRRPGDVERVLAWYAAAACIALVGGVIEKFGPPGGAGVIGTSVLGHYWATYRTGEALLMLSGFFRSPDVMGWHAATATMVAATLALSRGPVRRAVWIGLAGWGGLGIMLCARRKMVSLVPAFILCLLFMYVRYRHMRKLFVLAWACGAALLVGVYAYRFVGPDEHVEEFYSTTVEEAGGRLKKHAMESVIETFRQGGFLGHGLGMALQGAHHIKAARPRIWQEGGPAMVMAEVGVPGTLCMLLLLLALVREGLRVLTDVRETSLFALYAGIGALVLANGASGLISAQLFGDPFIGTFLVFLVGLGLSGARVRNCVAVAEGPAVDPQEACE